MRYLFIVQGDGRGHMTQAIALSEMLCRNGHEVVEVLIGRSKSREIPDFFVEKIGAPCREYETPSFVLKKNKMRVHMLKTLLYNVNPKRIKRYKKSIEAIYKRIQKTKPDVVINFYELLAGLTKLRFRTRIPFVNIGHQYLIEHPEYKFANSEEQSMMFFRLNTLLCKIGTTKTLALSFYPMKDSIAERIVVVPPLLRKEVLTLSTFKGEYILGYMLNHGYEEEIRVWHEKNKETELHFFWDKRDCPKEVIINNTLHFHTIDDEKFLNCMAGCKGYITTAGFESVCEAMYLDKHIMMIPTHIEQEINAKDASSTGNAIENDCFDISQLVDFIEKKEIDNSGIKEWIDSAEKIFLKHLTIFV